MRKITWKTGAVIVLYAVFLSMLSIGILFFLRNASAAKQVAEYTDDSGIYMLTREEWAKIMEGKSIQVDTSRITWRNVFDSYYMTKSYDWLPAATVLLCLFFLISSVFLWIILQQMQRSETVRLLRSMKAFDRSEKVFSGLEPAVQSALEEIRQKFRDNLSDYKRLSAYVSHEQKNSLSVLRTKMELKSDAEAVKIIDGIINNMEDILTLSADGESETAARVDVALVCAKVCDAYSHVTDRVCFDFEEDRNTTIFAKERWIYQAVNNLIENALKYSDEAPIRVFVKNRYSSVIITVKDWGIGIPEEKQEQIFQNRYRVNELNKDGYGIGLSLVSHVCNLCGGTVFVESGENAGSCFYLSFPEAKECD